MSDRRVIAAIDALRARGVSDSVILDMVQAMLGVEPDPAPMPIVPAMIVKDDTAERKRAADRERMREKREEQKSRDVARQSSDTPLPEVPEVSVSPAPLPLPNPPTLLPPKKTPTGSKKVPSPAEILAVVLTPERAEAVVEHRRKLRKPLTPLAAERLAAQFAKTSDPNEAAGLMVERGWQGFNPEWAEQGARDPPGRAGGASRWDEFFAKAASK